MNFCFVGFKSVEKTNWNLIFLRADTTPHTISEKMQPSFQLCIYQATTISRILYADGNVEANK